MTTDHANAGLLLLADSRLPTGGHAHSGGVEAAVTAGLLSDVDDLARWCEARVRTSGVVQAAVTAACCELAGASSEVDWGRWDDAVAVRTPSVALREASRAQGAALLRTARVVWRSVALEALARHSKPHHPVVLGVTAAAAGATAQAAALLALHHLVGGACSSAVRLLGLDPLAVAALHARQLAAAEPTATQARTAAAEAVAADDPALLPSTGTPLPEILAEHHARSEVRLFAS